MSKLINEYNYDAIHEQAMYLMKHRKHFKQSALDKWMEYFNTKCIGSKEEAEKAKAELDKKMSSPEHKKEE